MNKRTKLILLAVLIVAVVLGFYYLAAPADVAKTLQNRDVKRDTARFLPEQSVDIAMAMKLITHDPPKMLAPPEKIADLLLFPPSDAELARLSG